MTRYCEYCGDEIDEGEWVETPWKSRLYICTSRDCQRNLNDDIAGAEEEAHEQVRRDFGHDY